MKKNILITAIMGLLLFSSSATVISNAQEFERRECVEGYRFYTTMWCSVTGVGTYHVDVYEATNMCNAYRGVGKNPNFREGPTCYDVKKEDNNYYVYIGSSWWRLHN